MMYGMIGLYVHRVIPPYTIEENPRMHSKINIVSVDSLICISVMYVRIFTDTSFKNRISLIKYLDARWIEGKGLMDKRYSFLWFCHSKTLKLVSVKWKQTNYEFNPIQFHMTWTKINFHACKALMSDTIGNHNLCYLENDAVKSWWERLTGSHNKTTTKQIHRIQILIGAVKVMIWRI